MEQELKEAVQDPKGLKTDPMAEQTRARAQEGSATEQVAHMTVSVRVWRTERYHPEITSAARTTRNSVLHTRNGSLPARRLWSSERIGPLKIPLPPMVPR